MLDIQITNETDFQVDRKAVENLVEFTCGKYSITQADISIAIVDDKAITDLHRQFLGNEFTTDVMSFDLTDPDGDRNIFEIIVNPDMACRVAARRQRQPQSELLLYILHGLLHNIGFDDLSKNDFDRMHAAENEILEHLGYGRVFGDGEFGEE
jgi:probable rRNA maturation factor